MPNTETTREPCPTCGALPCDHVLNPTDDPTRKLLAEGLDLCARGRKLDQVEGVGATPWLWVQEQYEKDLAAWEDRARQALSGFNPFKAGRGIWELPREDETNVQT